MQRITSALSSIDPAVRAWLYRIAAAVVGLLVVLGALAEDLAQQVLLIAAAVLGLGADAVAAANTPRPPKTTDLEERAR